MVGNVAITQITSSALVVLIVQKLKTWKAFTWLQEGKVLALRFASIIGAFLSSIGVSYEWDPATRHLSLAIPTMMAIVVATWHLINHYAMQEIIYQATVNKNDGGSKNVPQSKPFTSAPVTTAIK
jgi:hypothetical protein